MMPALRIKRPKITIAVILIAILLIALPVLSTGCSGQQQTTQQQTAAANATTGGSTGKLQLPETYFDFGSAQVGQLVIHEFVIRNSGTGTLNLTKPDVKLLEGC